MCENPFFPCTSPEPDDIAVTIYYKEKDYQVCKDCWNKIGESDIQWEQSRKTVIEVEEPHPNHL